MRRDTIDAGSQPVRNYAGNPAFGTVSAGTTNVRQNLALYPNFEFAGATQAVAANISVDPRQTTPGSLGGYGTQTFSAVTGITDHPLGITTAARVTYTGAANPGPVLLTSPKVSTQYTISAYVYHETVGANATQGFAVKGVTANSLVINAGVWERVSWTYTTPASLVAGNDFGFRVTGQTTGGSYLITGVLIEESGVLGPYFDGATPAGGDFTYDWVGTANASTSRKRALLIGGWAATSAGVAYQSSVSPMHGTKCGAVLTKGINGDGLYHNNISVTAGMSYTVSIWVKLTSSVPSMNIMMRWKDNSDATLKDDFLNIHTSLIVGQWVRVSATFVAFAGATRLQPMVRVNATHTSTTFYVDSLMVEQSNVMTNYFDGTTPSTGDFTYVWSGTANQSSSNERVFNVPAAIAGRSNGVGFVDSKFFVYASTAEDGSKTCKWVTPAGTPSSNWRIAGITGNSQYGFQGQQIKAGGRYTLWFRYRAYGWGSTQTFQMQVADQTGQNVVAAYDTARLINTTGWTEYRRTFTAARDGSTATTVYASLPLVPQTSTDGVFEWREWMITEGEYNGDYIDGTKPFSKWEGTANGSTSVGYPPQLLDLAGKPDVDVSAVGSYTLSGGWSSTEPRTAYTVYNNLLDIPDSSVPALLTYGATALNDVIPNQFVTLRQQSWAGDVNFLLARRTGGAGAGVSGAKVGVNVATWGVNATGTLYNCLNNGATASDGSFVIDMPHEKIQIQPATAYGSHVRTLIYRGLHTPAQRAAVSRYLGNKYGAQVA